MNEILITIWLVVVSTYLVWLHRRLVKFPIMFLTWDKHRAEQNFELRRQLARHILATESTKPPQPPEEIFAQQQDQ